MRYKESAHPDIGGSMPKPPAPVRTAARKALERRRQRAKTTKRPGGTAVGIARARDLSAGRNVSERTVKRMKAFFDRHDTPTERAARKRNPNSPAAIAWGLWGGTSGRQWANAQVKKIRTRNAKATKRSPSGGRKGR